MNKTDIESDFTQRFGSGDIHTFFVPIPLTLMGGGCFIHGGSTLIAAMNAGVWVCGRINSTSDITIEETSGNVKLCLPVHGSPARGARPSYELIFSLAHRFAASGGADLLFHSDIPDCACINTEIPRCIASALITDKLFGTGGEDIAELAAPSSFTSCIPLIRALMNARKNHAVYIDGKEHSIQTAPFLSATQKIIAVYPKKKHLQKTPPVLKQAPPLTLNDLKLDSLHDKSSALYRLALSSQNTQSAFRMLKNNGSEAFLDAFSEKCGFNDCFGKFTSTTDIYLAYDNSADALMNDINVVSKSAVSFIVTGCSAGARCESV